MHSQHGFCPGSRYASNAPHPNLKWPKCREKSPNKKQKEGKLNRTCLQFLSSLQSLYFSLISWKGLINAQSRGLCKATKFWMEMKSASLCDHDPPHREQQHSERDAGEESQAVRWATMKKLFIRKKKSLGGKEKKKSCIVKWSWEFRIWTSERGEKVKVSCYYYSILYALDPI